MLIEEIMSNKAFQEVLKSFRTPIPDLFDITRYFLLLFRINSKFCRLELVNNNLDVVGFPSASFYLYGEKDINDEAKVIISKLKDWHEKDKFVISVYVTNTYPATSPVKLFERNNPHSPLILQKIKEKIKETINKAFEKELLNI